jgi:transcriptional regulator with XRE-family HTH domain
VSENEEFELGVRNYSECQDLMDKLVSRREELGVSQREMARRMGVSQPAVAQFELSSSNPTLSTIVRYANKLGVELQLSVK